MEHGQIGHDDPPKDRRDEIQQQLATQGYRWSTTPAPSLARGTVWLASTREKPSTTCPNPSQNWLRNGPN